jgi:hypothetical protein
MNFIYLIDKDSFLSSFNLKMLIDNSAFYPSSGIDISHIEQLNKLGIYSFVHADYSCPLDLVYESMHKISYNLGYRLISIKRINITELIRYGSDFTNTIKLNSQESKVLPKRGQLAGMFDTTNFKPYAIWALYEQDGDAFTSIKAARFSILHIGAETYESFHSLYFANKINPSALVHIRPETNITTYNDTNCAMYKMLKKNQNLNQYKMPDYIITETSYDGEPLLEWPDYRVYKKFNTKDQRKLAILINENIQDNSKTINKRLVII